MYCIYVYLISTEHASWCIDQQDWELNYKYNYKKIKKNNNNNNYQVHQTKRSIG